MKTDIVIKIFIALFLRQECHDGILFFAKRFFYGTIISCESREEREYNGMVAFATKLFFFFCLGRPIIPFSSFL